MTRLIRVLIVDDHYVVRQGLASLLVPRNGLEVVGEAATGQEAVTSARRLAPDVILMDMVLPDLTGAQAIARIVQDNPAARVLVLTSFGETAHVAAAMGAGARGYLLKDSSPDDLIHAIHGVYHGNMVLPQDIAQRLRLDRVGQAAPELLSDRELAVLRLLAQGLTNRQIAERLVIAPTTVRSHVSSILLKLHVANRTQAVVAAQERGLV